MPRKKMFSATKLVPKEKVEPHHPSQFEKDVLEYLAFCGSNALVAGPEALVLYGQAQVFAGLDRGAVANRLDQLRSITTLNASASIAHRRLQDFSRSLRREKARAGGPKRKPLVTAAQLMLWLQGDPTDERSCRYRTVWYILCLTGARPEELHHSEMRLDRDALRVKFNGRKNSLATGAAFLSFSFDLFEPPPPYVVATLKSGGVPKIGTPRNTASCINSWLRSFRFPEMLAGTGKRLSEVISSTVPRVRIDNILREQYEEGLITETLYEQMIGHNLKTSNESYRR